MKHQIIGRYDDIEEELDTASSREEAERLAAEYRLAFREGWAIWVQAANNASSM